MSHDIKKAMLDPDEVFGTPECLCDHTEYTVEEKIKILQLWVHDEERRMSSLEENMQGEEGFLLSRLLDCLFSLKKQIRRKP